MSQPTMEDTRRSLEAAAAEGNLDGLYASIKEAPTILDHIDAIPFVHTPLHIAASAGRNHFAKEILNLKPSLGRKLNPDGFSPLHLALRTLKDKKGHTYWQKKLRKTVKQLVKFDGELVRVRGREMFTPLHLVAQDDEVDLLDEFLRVCPASIEDVTVRDETALHIAVKNSRIKALKKLLGWLRKNIKYRPVINRGDEDGNTVLHIAAYESQSQIVKSLAKELTMEEHNKKNDDDLTGLDIARHRCENVAAIQIMNPFLGVASTVRRTLWKTELTMEMRNIILVVAVLIATATYQVILSPPGGGILDNKNLPTDQNGSDHIINGTISTINLLPGNNNITTPSNATIFLTTTSTTATNSTTNPIKRVLYKDITGKVTAEGYYYRSYIGNTFTFVLSIVVMMVVLPMHWITLLLHFSLLSLVSSYGHTFYLLVPSGRFATILLFSSYSVVAFVHMIYFFRFLNIVEIMKLLTRRQNHTESIRN